MAIVVKSIVLFVDYSDTLTHLGLELLHHPIASEVRDNEI